MRQAELVKQDMTHRAVCVRPEEDLYHAYSIMERCQFHHLPVVENAKLVGILADRDIFKHFFSKNNAVGPGKSRVRDAMISPPIICHPTDRLGDAVDLMLQTRVDALVVVDDKSQVAGILTTTDLLVALRRLEGVVDVGVLMEQKS